MPVPGLRAWAKKLIIGDLEFDNASFRTMAKKGEAAEVFTYLCAACAPQLTVLECEGAIDIIAHLTGVQGIWAPSEIFPDKEAAAQFVDSLNGLGRSALLREELKELKAKLLAEPLIDPQGKKLRS